MIEIKNVTKSFGGRGRFPIVPSPRGAQDRRTDRSNGSGKTTLFNLITGLIHPDCGEITLQGQRIDGQMPHHLAGLGLIRTFQLSRVFPRLTVMDNMLLAPQGQAGERLWSLLLRFPRVRREEAAHWEKACELLDMLGILHLQAQFAGTLSYGQQNLWNGPCRHGGTADDHMDEPRQGSIPRLIQTMIDMT